MNKSKLVNYFNIILVLSCISLIFLFSCDNAEISTKKTENFMNKIVNVSTSISYNTHFFTFGIVRKCAHFFEFFLLGFLIVNFIKHYKKLNIKIIIYCIFFCIMYAISDEIHQLFVSGRSCEIKDIIIDSSGSISGIFFYYLLYYNVNKTKLIKKNSFL